MAYLELNFKSEYLMRPVRLLAFLPIYEGSGGKKPFRTLYFLPGFSSDALETVQLLNLRMSSFRNNMAVILCDGDNALYGDRGDRVNDYRGFIEEEFVQVTRNLLPLSGKREDTFIGGISMGGHGALVSGLTRSDLFSKIVALSPSISFFEVLESGNFPFDTSPLMAFYGSKERYEKSDASCMGAIQRSLKEEREIPEILMIWGDRDKLVRQMNRRFVVYLKEKDIPVTAYEESGGHDFSFWNQQLDTMFKFLKK